MSTLPQRPARAPQHGRYDAVIVGGRVAGAATALLLARRGHRVLVLDREPPGRDTLSTHALMRAGVDQLRRWGLLDQIVAAGTPPVDSVTFHYGGRPLVIDVTEPLYAPRRYLFDRLLVAAAEGAGAEFRFRTTVDDVIRDRAGRVVGVAGHSRNGGPFTASATFTIGADGRRSSMARTVAAPVTRADDAFGGVLFGYWTGVTATGYEWAFDRGTSAGLIPTNDDQVCVWVGAPPARFSSEMRPDPEGAIRRILWETAPDIARRVAAGDRAGPIRGFPGQAGEMRRPWGPGWALVGDAAHYKDPATAHGMSDALRDAELLARALHATLTGQAPEAEALAEYERVRDDLSIALFDITARVASFDWDLEQLQGQHRLLSKEMQREARFLSSLDSDLVASPA